MPWLAHRYELFIDDLPMWGFVGEMSKGGEEANIFTHMVFDISYNKDRVGT
jgi:transmembrane 9 superfamily protein 3